MKIKISLTVDQVAILSTYINQQKSNVFISPAEIEHEAQDIINRAIIQYADDLGISKIEDIANVIIVPAGHNKNKFEIIDIRTNQKWANEYFTSIEDAEEFCQQNKLQVQPTIN